MNSNWNPAEASTWCRLGGELPSNHGEVIVVVDDSTTELAAFFELEASTLPDNLGASLLVIPAEPGESTASSLLREALSEMFPAAKERLTRAEPRQWIEIVKKQHERTSLDGCWILVDGFQNILSAPDRESRQIAEFLQEFAKLKSFGVIAGITTEKSRATATLLGLLEKEEPAAPEVEAPSVEVLEPHEPAEKTNTGRVWFVRAAAACLGVSVGVGGVYLLSRNLAEKQPEKVSESVAYTVRALEAEKEPEVEPVFVSETEPETKVQKEPAPEPATVAEVGKNSKPPLTPAVIQSIEPAGHTPGGTEPEEIVVEAEPEKTGAEKLREKWEEKTEDDKDVHYYMAEAYCFGHGVEMDLEKGIELLKTAAEEGSGKAANLLGTCYSQGYGVEKDFEQAHQLLEKAVSLGVFQAHGNLGVLYLQGMGCEKDPRKAREHFVSGALAGDPVAAFFAAKCYEDGIGNKFGERDPENAVKWYREAAKNGHEEAIAWCRAHKVMPAKTPPTITF